MKAYLSLGIFALILIISSGPSLGEVKFYDAYLSVLGSYDSNTRRLSTESGTLNNSKKGDIRALFFGGLGMRITRGDDIRISLDAKPYYIKYQDFDRADRGDIFLRMKGHKELGKGFTLNLFDKYRVTFFPDKSGRDQLFNSIRFGLSFTNSARWKYAVQYRSLYRDNPRENLTESRANGLAFTSKFNPHPRLTLGILLQRDYEKVRFVFPKDVEGRRTWVDLSIRYLFKQYLVFMGKYMYQKDSMDIVFLPGEDLEIIQESGEEITDGILQSIRFLEDTHNNFRKHVLILSALSKIMGGVWAEVFILHQKKYLSEKIVELPQLPKRQDTTTILQGSLQAKMNEWASFVLYIRFEENGSNDPDHDYGFSTLGLGSRISF